MSMNPDLVTQKSGAAAIGGSQSHLWIMSSGRTRRRETSEGGHQAPRSGLTPG